MSDHWSPQVNAVLNGEPGYDTLTPEDQAIVRDEWDRRIAERAASVDFRSVLAARGETTVGLNNHGDLQWYLPDVIRLTDDEHHRWLDALRSLPNTLALDLEGTLVSNAVSLFPRPGLHAFLDWAQDTFERVVLYTSVPEAKARTAVQHLAVEGSAPSWFGSIEIFEATGSEKDLLTVVDEPSTAVLLDDQPTSVRHDQRGQWVDIRSWDSPYPQTDTWLVDARLQIGVARWRAVLSDAAQYRIWWTISELEWSRSSNGPHLRIDDIESLLRRLVMRTVLDGTTGEPS